MLVPNFITAQDEILLRSLLIKKSLELNGTLDFKITHDGKKWVAWYYDKIENIIAEQKVNNEVKRKRSGV